MLTTHTIALLIKSNTHCHVGWPIMPVGKTFVVAKMRETRKPRQLKTFPPRAYMAGTLRHILRLSLWSACKLAFFKWQSPALISAKQQESGWIKISLAHSHFQTSRLSSPHKTFHYGQTVQWKRFHWVPYQHYSHCHQNFTLTLSSNTYTTAYLVSGRQEARVVVKTTLH